MDLFLVLVCHVHVIVGPIVLINKQPRSEGFGGPRLFKTHSCYKWPRWANCVPRYGELADAKVIRWAYDGPTVGPRLAYGEPTVGL